MLSCQSKGRIFFCLPFHWWLRQGHTSLARQRRTPSVSGASLRRLLLRAILRILGVLPVFLREKRLLFGCFHRKFLACVFLRKRPVYRLWRFFCNPKKFFAKFLIFFQRTANNLSELEKGLFFQKVFFLKGKKFCVFAVKMSGFGFQLRLFTYSSDISRTIILFSKRTFACSLYVSITPIMLFPSF